MQLGEERIRLLKQLYGSAAHIAIADLVNADGEPGGTQVIMSIPNINS
jgi:hypothetical protein